ncbi:putative ribonuclease H-like domain-containing protein [Tanacetum coccineum]
MIYGGLWKWSITLSTIDNDDVEGNSEWKLKNRNSTVKDGIVLVLTQEKFSWKWMMQKRYGEAIRTSLVVNAKSIENTEGAVFTTFVKHLKYPIQQVLHPSTSSTNVLKKKFLLGLAYEVIYSLFAKQSEDWDLLHEDLEQIDDVDIEEMDINWQIAMIVIRMKKFYKKTRRRVRVDGKTPVGFDKKKLECFNCHNTGHFAMEYTAKGTHDGKKKRDSLYQYQEAGKQEKNQMGLLTIDDGILKTLCDEQMNQLGDQEAQILTYSQAVKKLEAQLVTLQKQQLSLNEKLTFQANEIYEKDEKLKRYRRIGMKAVKEKEQFQKTVDSWKDSSKNLWRLIDSGMSSNSKLGLGYEIKSNNKVLSYEEEMNFFVFKSSKEDSIGKPSYSRFTKTNDFKGVPHPLSGDYTPKPQEEIDDSLYVYGKKGPQKPEISVLDDNSSEHSTCQDETSGILQTFIRQIENQLSHRVKIIRLDNGTEFKNRDMLEFCGNKGIKQEYSNARTPQQNEVAERMNRTLIEAARTMLADSLLPTTFWAEAKQANPHQVKERKDLDSLRAKNKFPQTDSLDANPKIQAFRKELEQIALKHLGTVPENNSTSTPSVNTGSQTVNTEIEEEPKKIVEALQDDSWVQAMQEELLQFKLQQRIKRSGCEDKARLVPEGYTQEGRVLNYGDCAPCGKKKLIRWSTLCMDCIKAPRAWYATLSTFLEKHGYKRGTIDKTLFIKRDKKDIMLVQVNNTHGDKGATDKDEKLLMSMYTCNSKTSHLNASIGSSSISGQINLAYEIHNRVVVNFLTETYLWQCRETDNKWLLQQLKLNMHRMDVKMKGRSNKVSAFVNS